jgi:hypothetical protein
MTAVQPWIFSEHHQGIIRGQASKDVLRRALGSKGSVALTLLLGVLLLIPGLAALASLIVLVVETLTALRNGTPDLMSEISGSLFWFLFTAIATAIFGQVFWRFWQTVSDQDRLIEEGRLIWGEIVATHIDHSRDEYGDNPTVGEYFTFSVDYRFRTPAGTNLTGTRSKLYYNVSVNAMPPIGTPLAAIYVDDNLYRVL